MARKHRQQLAPGDLEFWPRTEDERIAHADALRRRAEAQPEERAQLLTHAAEWYTIAHRDDQADEVYRLALADGGPVAGSLHGFYASFLFEHERDADALAIIEQARKLHPTEPQVFEVIGETLNSAEYFTEAATWFTTGLVRYCGALADIDLEDLHEDRDIASLVRGRHEARQELGGPPDHLDELFAHFLDERKD